MTHTQIAEVKRIVERLEVLMHQETRVSAQSVTGGDADSNHDILLEASDALKEIVYSE